MKIRNIIYIIILIAIQCLFYSCKEISTSPSIKYGVLTPLSIGNEWTYKSTEYDSVEPDSFEIDTFTLRISGNYFINDEEWFFRNYNDDSSFVRLINRDSGLYISVLSQKELQIAGYPIRLNDSVLFDSYLRTHENGQILDSMLIFKKITSLNTAIHVPAGMFNCIEVTNFTYDGNSQELSYPNDKEYYASNIGLIKSEHYDRAYDGEIKLVRRSDLVGYNLK